MGKRYDPDSIPDLGVALPSGRYLFAISAMDDSQPTSTGKYMISTTLVVHEPQAFANQPHFENFVIGTDVDPQADDPESWKLVAGRRYRDMLLKAGVELSGDIENDCAVAVGQVVGGIIEQSVQAPTNRDGSPNAYAGRVQSRVSGFFRNGEREYGVDGQNGPAPAAKAAPARAPLKPAPAKPASVPAAVAPAKPVAAPITRPPAKPAMLMCQICQQQVPKTEYVKHVQGHEAEEE